MPEGYNIKVAVDARAANRGVKSFDATLTTSLRSLREFDNRAKSAFRALDRLASISPARLNKTIRGTVEALRLLNAVKVNRSLINNLSALQSVLRGLRFSGAASLKKLPEAMAALSRMKIDTRFISTLNQIKAALRGFRGPPKSLQTWKTAFQGFDSLGINPNLPLRLDALKASLQGFRGPTRAMMNLPAFLRGIARYSLSPNLAQNLMSLRSALAGFTAPNARAVNNLARLIQVMQTANPAQIAKVAAQLQRLRGLNINVGRVFSQRMGGGGGGFFHNLVNGSRNSTFALRGLQNQMNLVYHASTMLRAALGGLTVGMMIGGIYETGTAYQSLVRSLAAVATSADEVNSHLSFLNQLTSELPINLESAQKSYRKFAIATRLAGFSIEEVQKTYKGFATAFSVMGLNAADQELGFLAIEQMVSKSAIQMEELKRQLADKVPGSVQMLAEAMGKTIPELMNMIQRGAVGAENVKLLADYLQRAFGGQIPEALKTSAAQLTFMQNAWINLKRIIFNSGFDTGLATMAHSIAKALESADAQEFAKNFGKAMGDLFKWVGIVGRVMIENRAYVLDFIKAFAAISAITAFGVAIRGLGIPLALLMTLLGGAGRAFVLFGRGIKALATVQVLAGITKIGSAFTSLGGRIMIAVAGILLLAVAMDQFLNQGRALESLVNGMKTAAKGVAGLFKDAFSGVFGGATEAFENAFKDATKTYNEFDNKKLYDDKGFGKNAERERRMAREKELALSKEEQKLWDKVNVLGKETAEYEKQLKVLDELQKKKGFSDEQKASFKKILDAQTLEKRDPLGSRLKFFHEQLDILGQTKGAQDAYSKAIDDTNNLLRDGVDIGKEGFDSLVQYYTGIAKMNGEIGNGFERWSATVGDFNDNLQNAVKDGIDGLSDAIVDFATGAEADFAGLARSILRSFAKIALDSLLQDAFKAMGLGGKENGRNQAEAALSKLANLGETIQTAQTNVYTSGLSIDGMSAGDFWGANKGNPELPSMKDGVLSPARAPYVSPGPTGFEGSPEFPGQRGAPTALADMKKSFDKYAAKQAQFTNDNTDFALTGSAWDYKLQKAAEESARVGAGLGLRGSLGPGAVTTGIATPTTNPFTSALGTQVGGFLNDKSMGLLSQVNPELAAIVKNAQKYMPAGQTFQVAPSTLRTYEQQLEYVRTGRSQTMNSNHLTGRAVDLNPYSNGQYVGKDLANYQAMQLAMKKSAAEMGIPMNWGGDWKSFKDGPHFELPRGYKGGAGGQGIDMATTGSIQQANAALKQTGQTMQQMVPQTQQMNNSIQQTGQQAQTAAQQQMTTGQMKMMTDQQATMSTQMNAMAVQQAGSAAQMSAPAFQQAGMSIQQASAQASTTTPQFGGLGQGISALMGPLSSVVPGLGQFGGAIMQVLSILNSGGGGMGGGGGLFGALGGLFGGGGSAPIGLWKEGGMSNAPVAHATAPLSAFANAPHFREGTPNVRGGIPSILHDNEAVIPLTRGRKVAVELSSRDDGQEKIDRQGGMTMVMNINGVKDADGFKRSKRQIMSDVQAAQQRAMMRG